MAERTRLMEVLTGLNNTPDAELSRQQQALLELLAVAVDVLDQERTLHDFGRVSNIFQDTIALMRKSCPDCEGNERLYPDGCPTCDKAGWVWRDGIVTGI